MVHLGVIVGVLAAALVFFAGRYLPYNDWAGHVGLSAVLAHGTPEGAGRYLERSFVPTPYLLFYLTTAAWAQLFPVEVAAKLNLLLTTALLTLGAARLCGATGRDPRQALFAPLALFGASLGLGFSSFLFGMPFLLFAWSELELLLAEPLGSRSARSRAALLAGWLALAFLGHGLVFLITAVGLGLRLLLLLGIQRRAALPALSWVSAAHLPSVLLAIPSVLRRLDRPYVSPEFEAPGGPKTFGWAPLSTHLQTLASDLLDRGGQGHRLTMALVVLIFLAWLLGPRRQPRPPLGPLVVYAGVLLVLFGLGPVSLGWPVTFWIVYQRVGTLAALLLLLVPWPNLGGRRGTMLALLALVPVVHNGVVNARIVDRYSSFAAPYDQVRAAVPPGKRVLTLTDPLPGDPASVSTLMFYHLVDGATYVPIGNIPEEMPVHRNNRPGTPYNPTNEEYRPDSVGRIYDYLVLRGPALIDRTKAAGLHALVLESAGWAVFRTLDPTPP